MILAAIDGRCASGKSTLAAALAEETGALVFHMDDFYRPRHLQTPEPGGNMDLARFRREVLEPLLAGRGGRTRTFDCTRQQWNPAVDFEPAPLVIVEGTYSLHPDLQDPYDFRIFLDVPADEQLRRIRRRSGENKARQFADVWIPREEAYLQAYPIRESCDMILGAGSEN